MLLPNGEIDLDKIKYPCYVSPKLDGVRVEITDQLLSRSMKPLRNKFLKERFKDLLGHSKVLEGELWSPTKPCREIVGIVNSKDKELDDIEIHLFDIISDKLFIDRVQDLHTFKSDNVNVLPQIKCNTPEEVVKWYTHYINKGLEGVVIKYNTYYKQGRLTLKEGVGYKLKPHQEDDLEIVRVNQRMRNTNESEINELGYKFKRNTILDKEPTGIASTFTCRYGSTTTDVTLTGSKEFRKEVWDNRDKYIGCYAVVKSMSYGTKDKLRHPRLLRIKERIEK